MIPVKPDENSNFFFMNSKTQTSRSKTMPHPHFHPNFEIYFITEGTVTYFIEDRKYSVRAGDIVLIPDGVIHRTEYEDGTCSRLLINCSPRYIPTSVRAEISSYLYLYRNPNVANEVLEIFEKIEKEYNSPDPLSESIIVLYIHMLFYILKRHRSGCEEIENNTNYMSEAVEYLKKNFTRKVTLSETAKYFSMSPEHFSRSFKKENGVGFNKYVNLLRFQRAEELLKTTEHSISEIAEQCGFDDSNYFSLKFKELYGVPPKSLRKSYLSAE